MSIWNHPDWKSQNPDIDAEHKKLNQMVMSLSAVVRNDSGIGLDTEAIDILLERMRLHFRMEEANADKVDPDACAILREDHARLLGLLDKVRLSMKQGSRAESKENLLTFTSELDRHDREIDIPLFRMMATSHDPLAH
ncbi:hypothetical protein CU669_14415 [Paramagnetospirillum kuznetsovii]|uniref:Hemerythrin-like domain-containing protein n=1 Tax=Paramagnetospirillum kuznetsovii TaxID=2053833 RepID=A0A364NVR4_9PROT|nr:hemerythrin domain-containing protein [Paramagnetospirillum kuznetsovii]RAU21143.1 hypothetical protein CU669_14415 [Paramagnetospirillum kuznetsovii]